MRVQGFGLAAAVLALAACTPQDVHKDIPTGAEDFATYCSACHGPGGKGDGDLAADMKPKPANLTTLAKRNGGEFPTTKVMAQIWGYKGKKGQGVMPDFSGLMDAENVTLVPYDGGDGIMTPTPIRLVQVAEYLKTIQVK
jgi:mono/diheme cytochrome c family protein